MDFPVSSVLEKSVNNQVNKLVGDKDVNLNTIVKMSLLNDGSKETIQQYNNILARMRSNNEKESAYIACEYSLTYGNDGNLVLVYSSNNIDDIYGQKEAIETDTGSIVSESEGSK